MRSWCFVFALGACAEPAIEMSPRGPSGLFMLYSSEITTVSIAAPGHQTRTLTVGGGFELDGSILAVLPKL